MSLTNNPDKVIKRDTLTSHEVSMLDVYRQRGLDAGLATGPASKEAADAYGRKLMAFLGRKRAEVILVDGPVAAWLATCLVATGDDNQVADQIEDQVRNQVWDQIEDQIEDQVWAQVRAQVWAQVRARVWDQVRAQVRNQVGAQVRNQVGAQVRARVWAQVRAQVRNHVGAQVWAQVWAQVGAQVRAQVRNQVRDQVRDQRKDFLWPYMDGHLWAHWVAWADYYQDVLGISLSDYSIITEQLEFGHIYPLKNCIVIGQRPTAMHFSDGLLHRDGDPAVEYADGTRCWALHGVRVEQWLAETPADQLDPTHFARIDNVEVRREFVRKVGIERIARGCDAKVLDVVGGSYELLSVDLGGDTGRWPYLKMLNPSIGVYHMEAVKRGITTVQAALQWRNQTDLDPTQLT